MPSAQHIHDDNVRCLVSVGLLYDGAQACSLVKPAGGTFALYSLITRYAHISTPSGSPNASDLHLSRYTSNSRVESSGRQGPKTTSEKVRALHSQTAAALCNFTRSAPCDW